jgi:hypothetical protein
VARLSAPDSSRRAAPLDEVDQGRGDSAIRRIRSVDTINKIKKALGKDKPESFVFGFTSGEDTSVLVEGDPDDMFGLLVELFQETIDLLRDNGAPQEAILGAGSEVLEEMRKALNKTGPRLAQ